MVYIKVGIVINGVSDDHNFKVHIPIVYMGSFNLTERITQWNEIKDWIDELVEWSSEAYSVQHEVGYMNVWFKESNHAMMCTLKWAK